MEGGGCPTMDPPTQTKVTTVGKNELYMGKIWSGHKLLGPKPPLPLLNPPSNGIEGRGRQARQEHKWWVHT